MMAREQRDNLHLPRQKLLSRHSAKKTSHHYVYNTYFHISIVVCMQIDCIIIEDTSSVTPDLLIAATEHGPTANAYCAAPEYLPKIRNVLFHPFSVDPASTHAADAFNNLFVISNGKTSDIYSVPMVPSVSLVSKVLKTYESDIILAVAAIRRP